MNEILKKKDETNKTEATVKAIVALMLNGLSPSYDEKKVMLAKADGNDMLELKIGIEKVQANGSAKTY